MDKSDAGAKQPRCRPKGHPGEDRNVQGRKEGPSPPPASGQPRGVPSPLVSDGESEVWGLGTQGPRPSRWRPGLAQASTRPEAGGPPPLPSLLLEQGDSRSQQQCLGRLATLGCLVTLLTQPARPWEPLAKEAVTTPPPARDLTRTAMTSEHATASPW